MKCKDCKIIYECNKGDGEICHLCKNNKNTFKYYHCSECDINNCFFEPKENGDDKQ